ncbi:Acetyltransferase, GNAT family [Pseudomonas putida KT2440]|uniref:Acetyltransferase, GNAT family n=2 Tax=Pseudomonas putida group TaxID=136845 RepID=Q88JR6_PSEPK|nr:Acetyltransferase, GNAT family [Pseudomonas putida KT2440]
MMECKVDAHLSWRLPLPLPRIPAMSALQFRTPVPADAERCYAIEIGAYEGDEAATLEKIRTRITQYPQGFLVLESDGEIVGFINSGCAHEVVMSDEAFKELVGHDPAAANVVIMSVVVDPAHQGKGYAKVLMNEFIGRMHAAGKQTIHLMCKEQHVALYQKLGYRYVKPSPSDHGGMAWHEMVMDL